VSSPTGIDPVSDREPAADRRSLLHFRLFGHLERVIDLDAEVSNGAFEPFVTSRTRSFRIV
jgi:hypothetical protein